MSNLVLSDIDGVCLQWSKGFEKFIERHPVHELPNNPDDQDRFNDIETELGLTDEETQELIGEFHESDIYAHLPPYSDALKCVNELSDKGFRFVAITAAGISKKSLNLRRYNLDKYFPGVFEDIHMTKISGTKGKVLDSYERTWWIEDSWKHALTGDQLGHNCFLIKRYGDQREQPKDTGNVKIVDSWHSIMEEILNQ